MRHPGVGFIDRKERGPCGFEAFVISVQVTPRRPSAECGRDEQRPSTALTEAEAAQFIGMSAAWLKKSRTRRFRGVIDAPPFIRAGVKRVVYRIEDLEAWQERHLEHVGPGSPAVRALG